jgi:hypothetical protein
VATTLLGGINVAEANEKKTISMVPRVAVKKPFF